MVNTLIPRPAITEYADTKDRCNMCPNDQTIKEHMAFQKSYSNKFKELRSKYLADKNMLLSNFLQLFIIYKILN